MFKELYTIAERIAKLKTVVTPNRNAIFWFQAGCKKSFAPEGKTVDKVGNMGLRSRTFHTVLSPHMYL